MGDKDCVSVLEAVNLNKTYINGEQKTTALKGVSFSLAKGELLVVMGRSGSGKTTLLNLLGAMLSSNFILQI